MVSPFQFVYNSDKGLLQLLVSDTTGCGRPQEAGTSKYIGPASF